MTTKGNHAHKKWKETGSDSSQIFLLTPREISIGKKGSEKVLVHLNSLFVLEKYVNSSRIYTGKVC